MKLQDIGDKPYCIMAFIKQHTVQNTTLAIINVHFTENAQTIAWLLGAKVPRERLESSEQADWHVLLVQADA